MLASPLEHEEESLFIPGRLWPLVAGLLLALAAEPVCAEDLEAGKAPSAIFAADCSGCHRSPRGLARATSRSSLAEFLREHYTTGSGPASELASYLLGAGRGEDRRMPKPAAAGETTVRPADKPRRRSLDAVLPPQTVPPTPERAAKRRTRGEPLAPVLTDPAGRAPELAPSGKGRPAQPSLDPPIEATSGANRQEPLAESRATEQRPASTGGETKREAAPAEAAAEPVKPQPSITIPAGPPSGAPEAPRSAAEPPPANAGTRGDQSAFSAPSP